MRGGRGFRYLTFGDVVAIVRAWWNLRFGDQSMWRSKTGKENEMEAYD